MKLLIFLITFLIGFITSAQVSESFNYQSVVRNSAGLPIINQLIGVRMVFQRDSIGGQSIYSETFTPTTNNYGLITLAIGTGNSISGDFATIDWTNGPYFIESAFDFTGGISYEVMGTSQLLSVPYALHATTTDAILSDQVNDADHEPTNELQTIYRSGSSLTLSQNGGTVEDSIAVYNAGAGIIINNGTISNEKIYSIGLWPELGGYVFWISADGKHGLVVETIDQGNASWYDAQDIISNPASHSSNGYYFRDWRVPTLNELIEIFTQSSTIGGFSNLPYWANTEAEASLGVFVDFGSGDTINSVKTTTYSVRAVRKF